MMRPREQYLESLKTLKKDIVTMGVLVEKALSKALMAIIDQDLILAEQIIIDDEVINNKEVEIEDKSITLIATEQPVAGDLRQVITGMKMVTQLERMGDHAVHIAKSVRRLREEEFKLSLTDVSRMGEICISMNSEMLGAFTDDDVGRARDLAAKDEEVDNLHEIVQRKSFAAMHKDESNLAQALELNYISRSLERFADHITNISEWIIYGQTGNHVDLNR